ncbi:hypothetical protein M9H77_30250 [Catharanthus roseus]|uniref:Uncharacterized protein n=1 Tax=Catharanthus roseus TaxID=4058 RepID=A0ACC0A0Z5_CATRO|nr:hypothetical protein M9H77_30250 [Catharanthus roseus]
MLAKSTQYYFGSRQTYATSRGTFLKKEHVEAWDMIEEIDVANCQWILERTMFSKAAPIHEVERKSLMSQMAAITESHENLTQTIGAFVVEKKSNVEEMMERFINKNNDNKFQSFEAKIKNLDIQVGQIANVLSNRPNVFLPSDIEIKPQDCKAVTLRSETDLENPPENNAEEETLSPVELKLFLVSYISHVRIIGDVRAVSFGGGLFLGVTYASKCLSSHASLQDPLLNSSSMFDHSHHDFGLLNNASFVESEVVGLGLDFASFDILHDKFIGRHV